MKQYLPGVYYKRFGSKYLLDQNPNSDTIFAKYVRNGYKIQWIMECEPMFGEVLKYQGNVYINRRLMSKQEGTLFLLNSNVKVNKEESKMKMVVTNEFPGLPLEECVAEAHKELAKKIDVKAIELLDDCEEENPSESVLSDTYRMVAEDMDVELTKIVKKEKKQMVDFKKLREKSKNISTAATKVISNTASNVVEKVKGGKEMSEQKVSVESIRKYDADSGVKAFADINVGEMRIKGYTVAQNKKTDELFVQNPSQPDKDSNWHSRAFTLDTPEGKALQTLIDKTILDAYKVL